MFTLQLCKALHEHLCAIFSRTRGGGLGVVDVVIEKLHVNVNLLQGSHCTVLLVHQ